MPRASQTRRRSKVTLSSKKAAAAMPPRAFAPTVYAPIATDQAQGGLAPWPLNDRYPFITGANLTLSYIAQVFRLATSGYRQQYVDLLNELLEMDPHLYSVVSKRIVSSAVGRIEVQALDLPEDHPRYKAAQEAAALCTLEVARIPNLTQEIAALLWAVYHGVSASEIYWSRDSDGWHPERLQFVHSRRLSYPDYQSWDVHIWDQGQVYGWTTPWGAAPTTQGTFGLRVADYPGKFIVHAPQLRNDYPTREGVGRHCAIWATLKRIGARGASAYLERFAKGFLDVSWTTTDQGKPRAADDPEIELAQSIAAAIGPGSGSYASHPDTITLKHLGFEGQSGAAKLTWESWINVCDAQLSKGVLGGTINTDHRGSGGLGGKGVAESQERGEVSLEQYDGTCLAETIKRDLLWWIIRLNKPELIDVVPNCRLHVEADPDPKALLEAGKSLTDMGAPVDVDALADMVGIPLIPNETKDGKSNPKPRRSYRSDFVDPLAVDPTLESEESKQQRQDALDAQQKLAEAKAKQPVMSPNGDNGGESSNADTGNSDTKPPKKGDAKPADKKAAKGKRKLSLGADEEPLYRATLVLLKDRPDNHIAREAYEQSLCDYPAWACGWILAGHWKKQIVPLDEIDFSKRDNWRASKDGTVPQYVDKIKAGKMKPVLMVKTPGNPKLVVIDGHHRTLAYESMGEPVPAYVAEMHVDHGPWLELHAMQKKHGGASGSTSPESSYTSLYPDDDNASFIARGEPSI